MDRIFVLKMASTQMLNLVRNFSTSGVKAKLVKAPLAIYGVEGRYATALYSAASKQKKLEVVDQELKNLQQLVKINAKFQDFLKDPSLKKKLKTATLDEILKKIKCSDVTMNFMGTLAEHGRLNNFNSIANAFVKIMAAHRGEVDCEITTAKALDAGQLKELENSLAGFLKKGESMNIATKTDPEILGGMVVVIGDRYADMSLSSKIKNYTNLIKMA